MKRFTVLFSVFLILAFAGTLIYVAASPDFVKPAELAGEGENPDAPVWSKTLDDLLTYLGEKGLVDPNDTVPLTEGIASEATNCSGVECYWWDLENLSRDSAEYTAYEEMRDEGMIDLWGMGMYYMAVTKNGPFGINPSGYAGDVKALLEAYQAFGQ